LSRFSGFIKLPNDSPPKLLKISEFFFSVFQYQRLQHKLLKKYGQQVDIIEGKMQIEQLIAAANKQHSDLESFYLVGPSTIFTISHFPPLHAT
jgi:hypothetical protein